MCWGFECGEGWYDALKKLSCGLEALNLLVYDKYKVRIQADQVKEKYGTLHFYYSVMCDNYTDKGLEAQKTIDDFEALRASGHFGIKCVVDEKGYTSEETDEDGKVHAVWHQPKTHIEVTKNKEEYDKLLAEVQSAQETLAKDGTVDITPEQKVMMEWLENEAEKLINKAEEDCYDTCEMCGAQIGTDWSPRCETTGWITYKCKECARKSNVQYLMNGELWEGKTRLKTKEEVEADRKAFEEKFSKCESDEDTK